MGHNLLTDTFTQPIQKHEVMVLLATRHTPWLMSMSCNAWLIEHIVASHTAVKHVASTGQHTSSLNLPV